ncbi:MAG: ATP-binding protein [Clostridiales bacterium]|nr:ATP-binding protein [Candidatus Blautia equi]
MALKNFQYDAIMREYSRRQSENQRLLNEHREEIYHAIPRIAEIDSEVASLCARTARMRLMQTAEASADLTSAVSALSSERRALLLSNGYPADYLEMSYECPLCQDTGYIEGQKCTCFRKKESHLLYAQSNLREILEKENFSHFSFEYYSAKITDEKTGLTALDYARRAYGIAASFVQDFDTKPENLCFYGNTGVGKTFLSHCIAKELIDSSHYVLYFSAYDLFDLMARAAFDHARDAEEQENHIFDCDLLIIDDLGTELTNTFVSTQLFLILNERLMRKKSTIISTNLNPEDLSDTYSQRTYSRIISNFRMVKLLGNDIRIQKLF